MTLLITTPISVHAILSAEHLKLCARKYNVSFC